MATKSTKFGSIPDKLTLFCRAPADVCWGWEDVEGGEISHKVRPVFISDASNKKTCESGS